MLAEGKRIIVAVHSYKGGTGKTLVSANLATLFAVKGKKTCLLDMDFRAPSLNSFFRVEQSRHWFNDYVDGGCEAEEVFQNCCSERVGKEKLYVGLANPAIEAIRNMTSKDRKWEMKALTRLFFFERLVV